METKEFNRNRSVQAQPNRQFGQANSRIHAGQATADTRVGQAIVEYILLLSIILTFSMALFTGVSSTRDKAWKRILCVVSAACADCKATQSAKDALKTSGVSCKN